jgi:cytochrome P450
MGIDWLALTPQPQGAAEVARLIHRSPPLSGPLPGSLRTDEPRKIRWGSAPNGNGTWIVTDYELARSVLVDPRVSRAAAVRPGAPRLGLGEPARDAIISLEGAEHARLRRLIAGAFTDRRVAALSPFIDGLVTELLDDVQNQTAPIDLVASLTAPLPLRVLCSVLGIPWQDHAMFGPAIAVLFETQGDAEDNRTRSLRLVRYMSALIAQKRRSGGGDLLCALIEVAEDGDRLTNRELVTLALSLLMAGYETTVDQLTLCILSLLVNPELAALLRDDVSLIPTAVAEIMRVSPAMSVLFHRVATQRMTIAGQIVERGDPVVVSVLGANHSIGSAVAPGAARHLTFGHGVHRCVGAPLARIQLASAVHGLLQRFPGLELADDPTALSWKAGSTSRGLTRLNVTWPSENAR